MVKGHTFQVPVMGLSFSIESPLKISRFGIDSVMSLADDRLLESLRKVYCAEYTLPYEPITDKVEDSRAKRITSYLNLVNKLCEQKMDELKNATTEKMTEVKEYFNMMPEGLAIKEEFTKLMDKCPDLSEIKEWLRSNMKMGSIDVNIMTKVDKDNNIKKEKLPIEYKDAQAAIRG